MLARRTFLKVDGRATIGTIHHSNVFFQLRDLLGRERADEVLLAKEFEETDESAMAVVAAEVVEPRVPLHVLSGPQMDRATRTTHFLLKRRWARGLRLADQLQQTERRTRRKLQAFEFVEPKGLARAAPIDADGLALMAFESHRGHFSAAVGTVHRRPY